MRWVLMVHSSFPGAAPEQSLADCKQVMHDLYLIILNHNTLMNNYK